MQNKAYAINMGVDRIDPDCYEDYDITRLETCEADAEEMNKIANSLKYEEAILLQGREVTKAGFEAALAKIQPELKPGDLFFISFSGHGGQIQDTNMDEADGYDETWCFYDGHILDDHIHDLLKTFDAGIRILVISDSCYSGDILRDGTSLEIVHGISTRIKLAGVKASVRLIGSCQDYELSRSLKTNGLFTTALLKVWDNGNFKGNYEQFYREIVSKIKHTWQQTPNHLIAGPEDKGFDDSKPFVA